MTVLRSTATVMVKRTRLVTVALAMDNASTAYAPARTDGVALTAIPAALEMASAAAVTESAWRVTATATRAGLAMAAIFVLVCMIALNTDTATMAPACAKRDTVVGIALCLLSPNRASAQFTASVAACNSAPRSMRLKELVLLMSAIPSAHRSVFLNASLERCLLTSWAPPSFPPRVSINSSKVERAKWRMCGQSVAFVAMHSCTELH